MIHEFQFLCKLGQLYRFKCLKFNQLELDLSSHNKLFTFSDASSFGVSEVLIGVILGMYHLTVFFVAPLTPMLIDRINVECTLKLGIAVAGCSAILFGGSTINIFYT